MQIRGVRAPLRHIATISWAVAMFIVPIGLAQASPDTAVAPTPPPYDPAAEGSLPSIAQRVGATTLWANGYTGKGVDVAVIDTGVSPVEGLAGKIINGPDLSFDSQNPNVANGLDAFGHGTHMASIIAGRDVDAINTVGRCATCTGNSGYSDTRKFVGIAPDARIVNVRAGASDGAVDVTQVIAAIDWVVEHRNDNGLNIKVLNLSYGTDSIQPYDVDPLAFAVENAWKHGVFVVAAGGNDGAATTLLANPAASPHVLAVGAVDGHGTTTKLDDDVPAFANHGTLLRGVDVVAPAMHVTGLRVPGSYVDQNFGSIGNVGTRHIRGTGTSQAAAVVSGLAADLFQRYPKATPDQMKTLLTTTADTLRGTVDSLPFRGHGVVNGAAALSLPLTLPVGSVLKASTGLGSLERARGTSHVSINGQDLVGERDIFGAAWDAKAWTAATAKETAWVAGKWRGAVWAGSGWAGTSWQRVAWSGSAWRATNWSDQSWTGSAWRGSAWRGSAWRGSAWRENSWSSNTWI